MPAPLKVSLSRELHEFVKSQSGDGTPFATADEYVSALIAEERDKQDAAQFRRAVLEGYQDILAGRVTEYKGDIRDVIRRVKKRDAGLITPQAPLI